MRTITFSEADVTALHYERFHHPHVIVARKMEAIYLYSQGIRREEIYRLVRISRRSFNTYLKQYFDGGVEGLKVLDLYRPKSELEEYNELLKTHFEKNPPSTINHAIAMIEEQTGLKRSPTQVRKYLNRLGLKLLKAGILPAKADPVAQEDFKKKTLNHV
jgi:transposase